MSSHPWLALRQYVESGGAEWTPECTPSESSLAPILSSYFQVTTAARSKNIPRLNIGLKEFIRNSAGADPALLAQLVSQLFAVLDDRSIQELFPILDCVSLHLLEKDHIRALYKIFRKVPFEHIETCLPATLKELLVRPRQMNLQLLLLVCRYWVEQRRQAMPQNLFSVLSEASEQSQTARREILSLAVTYPDCLNISAREIAQIEERSTSDPLSLYYISQIYMSEGTIFKAYQAANSALYQGNFEPAILMNLFRTFAIYGDTNLACRSAAEIWNKKNAPADFLTELGFKLFDLESYLESEEYLLSAMETSQLEEDTQQKISYYLLRIAIKIGPYEQIIERYQIVEKFHPQALPFHLEIVQKIVENGDAKLAVQHFSRYSPQQLVPSKSEKQLRQAFLLYASALDASGQPELAFETMKAAIEQFGQAPELMASTARLAIKQVRCREIAVRFLSYNPPTIELSALTIICLTEANYHERVLQLFRKEIIDIANLELRDRAIQAYITCLARMKQWEQVSTNLKHLSPGMVETQWGIFHAYLAEIMSHASEEKPDLSAIALSFERLLSNPLTFSQLSDLARYLSDLFRRFPETCSNWRWIDLEAYLLLYVTDRVERCIEVARSEKTPLSMDVIRRLQSGLSNLSLDTVWSLVKEISDLGLEKILTKQTGYNRKEFIQ